MQNERIQLSRTPPKHLEKKEVIYTFISVPLDANFFQALKKLRLL